MHDREDKAVKQLKAALYVATTSTCLSACALASPPNNWSKIQGKIEFKGWDTELRRLVQHSAHNASNTFCLVVDEDRRDHQAYVYWPQENKLITWGASEGKISALDEAGAPLDLTRDVVATQDKIGTSTFLVTRAWVDRIISACQKFGTTLTITKL